jgi:hypothetical protein
MICAQICCMICADICGCFNRKTLADFVTMFTVSLDDCDLKTLTVLHLQNAIVLYLQMICALSSLYFFTYRWIQFDAFFCFLFFLFLFLQKTIASYSLMKQKFHLGYPVGASSLCLDICQTKIGMSPHQ